MKDENKLLLDVWTSLIAVKEIAMARKDLDKYEIAKLSNATRQINNVKNYFASRPENPTISSQNKDLLPIGEVNS